MIPTNANALIYNEFGTGTGRRFIKHIIHDVFWDESKGQNVINMGVTDASGVTMFVEFKSNYITPAKWKLLTLDEVMTFKYFTIRNGDVIILGTPDAPNEFRSDVETRAFFGIEYAHTISSVDAKIEPRTRKVHYFEIMGS